MSNLWLERRVLNFAHQGGAWEAPSSTLLAMRQAVAGGAHALELDVHATADRELVVCHDPTVERTTNGSGPIASMDLEELQTLDNAFWWVPGTDVAPGRDKADYPLRGRAPLDASLRIATLREVLEEFPDVFLNLDIKQTAPAVEPYEDLLADLLHHYGRGDDVIVASFHDSATAAFAAFAPDIALAYGTTAIALFLGAVRGGSDPPAVDNVAFQVPTEFLGMTIVDEAFVAAAHRSGAAVHVWTIDDEVEMHRLLDLGVDGIVTNRPVTLAAVLSERRVAWNGKG
ncbi:MAG TPA: glycerophosphodiester phosphodiesterase [Acidimicrobiales bacterium]